MNPHKSQILCYTFIRRCVGFLVLGLDWWHAVWQDFLQEQCVCVHPEPCKGPLSRTGIVQGSSIGGPVLSPTAFFHQAANLPLAGHISYTRCTNRDVRFLKKRTIDTESILGRYVSVLQVHTAISALHQHTPYSVIKHC